MSVPARTPARGAGLLAEAGAAWLLLCILAVPPEGSGSAWWLALAVAWWWAFLLGRLALVPSGRPLTLFSLAFTAYSTAAWVAATRFDLGYPPYPSHGAIEAGTRLSLAVVASVFLVLRLLPVDLTAERLSRSAARALARASSMGAGHVLLAGVPLLSIGAHDWWRVLSLGLGSVLASPRREFKAELLSESSHNVQLVAVAASVALGLFIAVEGRRRGGLAALAALALAMYWLPQLAIGARKTLFIAGATVWLALLLGRPPGRGRRVLSAVATLGTCALFLLPIARGERPDQATIEFVYPQHLLFAAIDRPLEDGLGLEYGYGRGAWLMLPSALRPTEVRDLGSLFEDTGLTDVGIGAHPVGEAYAASPRYAFLLATLASTGIVLLVALLARGHEAFLLVGAIHLLLWGRSDFWVTAFFVCYEGLVLSCLLAPAWLTIPRTARPRTPSIDGPARPPGRGPARATHPSTPR